MAEEVKDTRYPAWKYHATKEPRVVYSEEEDMALGKDWSNVPFKHPEKEKARSAH